MLPINQQFQNRRKYGVVAAVNNEQILANNLAVSPILGKGITLHSMRGYSSAGLAYNAGLDASGADVIIFAHQDVYLPRPWLEQLRDGIRAIEQVNDRWAVIGVYGVKDNGEHVGHCWSTGLNRVLGSPFDIPQRVVSIDELVIILRRSSGLRFDEELPGFHLYGTDIVQTALSKGFGAYVIHAPVVHNSRPVRILHGAYADAYRYMQKKWRRLLPIFNCIVPITYTGYPLWRWVLRRAIRNKLSPRQAPSEVEALMGNSIARRLGFEAAEE